MAAHHTVEDIHCIVKDETRQNGTSVAVNTQGPGGYTPLMVAILSEKNKHTPRLQRLHPSLPTRSDSSSGSEHGEGDSLLESTNFKGKSRISPAKAKQQTSALPQSPLHALITPQTNLSLANDRGETALHVAAMCSHGEYVQLLLKAKADPNQQDMWGQSVLHVAIGASADGVFRVSVCVCVCAHMRVCSLLRVIQLSPSSSSSSSTQVLLDHPGTNLELKSKGGITPLMLAVKMVNNRMVHALVTKGVEISATDSDGTVTYSPHQE